MVEQIVCGLRVAIATGEVRPGAELPPVRQLASDLGVNHNTVARAYQWLQHRGLAHGARGRGTRVIASREVPMEAKPLAIRHLREAIRQALASATLAGLGSADTRKVVEEQLNRFDQTRMERSA
jgi:GntR family transcriptional regulator